METCINILGNLTLFVALQVTIRKLSLLKRLIRQCCDSFVASNRRNMSGHALMGRPDARLETMLLVFSSYVVVCIVCKRRRLSLYGCYLLILCDDNPVFLTETAY